MDGCIVMSALMPKRKTQQKWKVLESDWPACSRPLATSTEWASRSAWVVYYEAPVAQASARLLP